MATFQSRLKEIMEEKGIKASEISNATGISPGAVSKYLSDENKRPLFEYVLNIAKFLDVDPRWLGGSTDKRKPFSEPKLIRVYEQLSPNGKREVYNYANYLLDNETVKYSNTAPLDMAINETSTTYDIPMLGRTAAGAGVPYGDPLYDTLAVRSIPKNADFALLVKGDSMEPTIKNNSIVFVKSQPAVENGEIAIIDINGEVTCKKVYYNNGQDGEGSVELRSINPIYKPLFPHEARIIGKVIL
ncbi:MAG: helix-turn-helix domain-containing protein [Clostridium sp.]|nr:helix-turn-helix domain-containing protein [Clostridium sp.]